MKKIKADLALLILLPLISLVLAGIILAQTNPLEGKVIALDAGHGGEELGAQYPANCANDGNVSDCKIFEKDVNWDVVQALKAKLEAPEIGAYVVVAERFSTRRDRVNDAVAKCAELDVNNDGTPDNKKCDVLVSVHHNGSTDPTHDGTLTIYTQNSDKPLAKALLDSLITLTGNNEGMLKGGYGMTVYKNLVSVITEAYYITNDCEAELYLYSKEKLTDISQWCKDGGYSLENRIDREAQLQLEGLLNYFSILPQKPGRK